jgi:hypothetical protein
MAFAAVFPSRMLRVERLWTPTVFLCIAGVILPNALSLVALVAGIGAPPRTGAIMIYATLALLARMLPSPLTIVLYLAAATYDAITTIALLFNLAPTEILLALRLSGDLKLFSSPLYIAMMSGLAVLLCTNIAVLVLRRDVLARGNPSIMMGLAVAFAVADFFANTSVHYQFGTLYAAGKPMDSAVIDSGFRPAALATRSPHVLLVVVEALGHFDDPGRQKILLQPFDDPDLRSKYNVTFGTTTYYGSTTAAEMRELCETRNSYETVLDGKKFICLPKELKDRGYQTVAVHNFTGAFFDRMQWYPKLGFDREIFMKEIAPSVHRLCGGPFRGPCDADVAQIIQQKLRDAKQPTFFYWMTLSTHVPIAPHEGTPRLDCAHDGGRIGHVEVCYMTELWMDMFQGVVQLARDLPDTEVLLVGDHAPPLWSKAGRELFTPGKVTWVRLAPKRAVQQAGR